MCTLDCALWMCTGAEIVRGFYLHCLTNFAFWLISFHNYWFNTEFWLIFWYYCTLFCLTYLCLKIQQLSPNFWDSSKFLMFCSVCKSNPNQWLCLFWHCYHFSLSRLTVVVNGKSSQLILYLCCIPKVKIFKNLLLFLLFLFGVLI